MQYTRIKAYHHMKWFIINTYLISVALIRLCMVETLLLVLIEGFCYHNILSQVFLMQYTRIKAYHHIKRFIINAYLISVALIRLCMEETLLIEGFRYHTILS